MNEAVDVTNDYVSEESALTHAEVGLLKSRLEDIIKTLPGIAANDNSRIQLNNLLGHVKGWHSRIRADLMRQRLGELPE